MKKLISIAICVVIMLSFAACQENDTPVAEKTKIEVTFDFNEDKSVNNKVSMDTSLPVGTLLDVDIFVGDKYHSTETVEVQADMASNYFITESQYDENNNLLDDGRYILSFEIVKPSKQPASVQQIIGNKGQYMTGLDVYTDGDGKTVKFSRPIEKKGDTFTMPE